MMDMTPLFVCHANCCRSVLARYLYEHHCPGCTALGAGVEAGGEINDRALGMLRHWGVDASGHRPTQLTRALCDQAGGIFLMGPEYLRRLLFEYGSDLAAKAYLFADPFALPRSFRHGEYLVFDPSFDDRPVRELTREFRWFGDRVVQIRDALAGRGSRTLVPAVRYLAELARC
jgi:protein-tyrosine-phosphatase